MPQGAQGANANMQFMDFNRAQAYPNYDAYAPRATSSGSHGYGGGGGHGSGHQGGGFGFGARDGDVGGSYAHVEDEAPLLEELGVDPKQIYRRTMGVMHPFRV